MLYDLIACFISPDIERIKSLQYVTISHRYPVVGDMEKEVVNE